MDQALAIDEVVPSLWNAYKKTKEYSQGLTKAIPVHHPIVEKQEESGLRRIYLVYVKKVNKSLQSRTVGDWLKEWKGMNSLLFKYILKKHGHWRQKELRIGDPYDDSLKLADSQDVPRKVTELAHFINTTLNTTYHHRDDIYEALAQIHFRFVMIHPFDDGNGRIARAITDQISLFLGLPTAIVGYPRHDTKEQKRYHQAIHDCALTKTTHPLALWIKSYVERQIEKLA